MEQAQYCRT